MCYNVVYYERKIKRLQDRYDKYVSDADINKKEIEEAPFSYFVNGFSHQLLPFIKADGLHFYNWGLVPHFIKGCEEADKIRAMTLNAVGETVFEKPSFRQVIRGKRGILPVNGFIEWRDIAKKKYPYFIKQKDEDLTSLGCVYENWTDKNTGEVRNTFSIVTTVANPLMESIHNLKKRMPLILDRESEDAWLNPETPIEQVKELIRPFDQERMLAHTISTDANSGLRNRNREDIIQEVKYAEVPEITPI